MGLFQPPAGRPVILMPLPLSLYRRVILGGAPRGGGGGPGGAEAAVPAAGFLGRAGGGGGALGGGGGRGVPARRRRAGFRRPGRLALDPPPQPPGLGAPRVGVAGADDDLVA